MACNKKIIAGALIGLISLIVVGIIFAVGWEIMNKKKDTQLAPSMSENKKKQMMIPAKVNPMVGNKTLQTIRSNHSAFMRSHFDEHIKAAYRDMNATVGCQAVLSHNGVNTSGVDSISVENGSSIYPYSVESVPEDDGPTFDESIPRIVNTVVGRTVLLGCKINRLGNRTVTWVRTQDVQILTVSDFTYTTDTRFKTMHRKNSDEWTLKITYVQTNDVGLYECQVSTRPNRIWCIYLNVLAPAAEIHGAPDLYVNVGSSINLTCVVRYGPDVPTYMFWFHNKSMQVANYDGQPNVQHEMHRDGEILTSNLVIYNASIENSGRYVCSPSNADPTDIFVHIIQGDGPEAMHKGAGKKDSYSFIYCIITVFIIYYMDVDHLYI